MKIGLLSDTHGYLDPEVFRYFSDVDEIWHAGDIGSMEILDSLKAFKPTVAVYGNIDDQPMRQTLPEDMMFERSGLSVWMTHIGGYPPKYNARIRAAIDRIRPGLFVCGHSHILRIMPDTGRKPLLYINPGAAGRQGLHRYRTLVQFDIIAGRIERPVVIRLGTRGSL
jgi:putative phosphoesterase